MTNKESTALEDTATILGSLALIVIIPTLACVIDGIVVKELWKWFVVSWFALPTLSIVEAIGLTMTVKYITTNKFNTKTNETEEDKHYIKNFMIYCVLSPLIALLLGYIIHLFM